MKHIKTVGWVGVICILMGFLITGCDAVDDDSSASSDVSGSWLYSDTAGRQSTWALVQSTDSSIAGAGTNGETISGSISADSINLSLSYASSEGNASLSGTVASNTMRGAFTNTVTGSGSWTAVKTN